MDKYFSKPDLARVFLGHRHPAMKMRHWAGLRAAVGFTQGWVHCSAVSKAWHSLP